MIGASFSETSGIQFIRTALWVGTASMHGWNSHVNATANDGVNPEGVLGRRAGVTPATKTRMAVGESTLVMSLWRVRSCA